MKFWFDTEFYENGRTIDLISIGVVAEDGREYYAETRGAERWASATSWLVENVKPHLGPRSERKEEDRIARELIEFMGDDPEIWADYAAYDWVVLCQLFGTMMDLPKGWPMFVRDIQQMADDLGLVPDEMIPHRNQHNALADAKWAQAAWLWMQEHRG